MNAGQCSPDFGPVEVIASNRPLAQPVKHPGAMGHLTRREFTNMQSALRWVKENLGAGDVKYARIRASDADSTDADIYGDSELRRLLGLPEH